MEEKLTFRKFLFGSLINIIYISVAHFISISGIVYSFIMIFRDKHILEGFSLLLLMTVWLIGYWWRLKKDYKAYLNKINNKNNNN